MRPTATSTGWYHRRDGQRIGPLPIEEVARLLAAGELLPSDRLLEIEELKGGAGPALSFCYVEAAFAVKRSFAADGRLVGPGNKPGGRQEGLSR